MVYVLNTNGSLKSENALHAKSSSPGQSRKDGHSIFEVRFHILLV